jgi:flagellar hook-associated protein 2
VTTFNVSGLVSGIDTSSLISQLMTVAAAPQTALQNQVAVDQTDISAYQAINSQLASTATAAQTMAAASTWQAATATSSDPSVVASAGAGASSGNYSTFSVLKVAVAQVSTLSATSATIADPSAGIDIVGSDSVSHHVSLTDGSPAGVAAAINAAGLGVRAAVVNTDSGSVLQLTASSTGVAGAFTVNGLSGTPQTLVAAQDAQISVGDPANGGYTISNSTNTFTNAIPGVTFTVSKPATNVTISVATDQTSISNNVQAMITAANTGLTTIGTLTAQGGTLDGDTTLSGVSQQLLSVVSAGTSSGGSFSTYGISINSTGQLTFDASAFATAYAADPAGTQAAVSQFATNMNAVATNASDPTTGSITAVINSETSQVTDLTAQIATWTTRLADQQATLQAKYAAMETALASMKSQQSYLDSMFASMNGTTSSSSSSSSSSN